MSAYGNTSAAEKLLDTLPNKGLNAEQVLSELTSLSIETPSWAYADSGTRFGVFTQPGSAKTIKHKLADAAEVHKHTGASPSLAVHVRWDFPNGADPNLTSYAQQIGISIGAINPNLFEEQCYKYGSLAHRDKAIRRQAIQHVLDCIALGEQLNSSVISLWLGDGTNYPGQDDIALRRHRLIESLQEIYAAMTESMTLLIEYKPFEPALYQTDIADWGMALLLCRHLGDQAKVLVDIGHHYQTQNIEQIVTWLIEEDALGGFHFNDRRYADDDLTTASIDPYQVFRIFNEIVSAKMTRERNADIAYMVDQSHNLKPKIEAMIQTIDTIHQLYAKALIVDRNTLQKAQTNDDIVLAEETLRDAYLTDTRPLIGYVRQQKGIDPDAISAFRASGYNKKIESERAT